MKKRYIHGTHIFESDMATDLDEAVAEAYHYGATEAEIRTLIDTFGKEEVHSALEKEIFLTLRPAVLWQYGWLQPEEVTPIRQLVEKGVSKEWLQPFGTDTPQMSYEKRQAQVARLLSQLSQPNTEIPQRKHWQKVTDFLFEPYDVFSIALPDGEYGAVWLIITDNHGGDGVYVFAELEYKSKEKPTMATLRECRLQLTSFFGEETYGNTRSVYHKALQTFSHRLEKVGEAIPIKGLSTAYPFAGYAQNFEAFSKQWNSDTILDKRRRKKFKNLIQLSMFPSLIPPLGGG
ncbi:MAG: hypothetical protein Q3983_03355, partial [Capnocytophaga sp.]|nr:hypothetical protein [Capnocytophaga sp.]